LAILLLPTLSRFEGDAGMRGFQAAAAPVSGSKSIIQNYCVGNLCYVADLAQLERDAVNAYLGLRELPPGDAHIIYDHGRRDLRNEVRALIVDILLGIINEPPGERDAHERSLYQWLQSVVQQNEIEQYRVAISHFQKWQSDPCTFALDSDIAREYKLEYNG